MVQAADTDSLVEAPRSRRVLRRTLEYARTASVAGDKLATLAAASRAFAEAPNDEAALLEIVARTVASSTRAGCAVHLGAEGRQAAVTVTSLPESGSFQDAATAERIRQHFDGAGSIAELSTATKVFDTGEALIVPSADIDPTRTSSTLETLIACEGLGIDSLLLVPLRAQGESIGLLVLFRDSNISHFDARDSQLARILADQATLAIKTCRLSTAVAQGLGASSTTTKALARALEQVRHADRLATVGAMVAGVAHEIGTPLHVIAGYAELIAGGQLQPDSVAPKAAVICAQANNVARILRQLLGFAHGSEPNGEPASVLQVASTVAELLGPPARAARVSLIVSGEPVSTVVDEQRMSQVLVNLVANAIHASPDGGTVEISIAAVKQLPPGGTCEIPYVRTVVRDAGIGISDEVKGRLFEPFFTTKGVGKGTGLGLSVVEGIVKDYAGWVTVDSKLGSGSRFSVFLPAADTTSGAEQSADPHRLSNRARQRLCGQGSE